MYCFLVHSLSLTYFVILICKKGNFNLKGRLNIDMKGCTINTSKIKIVSLYQFTLLELRLNMDN